MGIFGNNEESFIGVDIGAHGIKLVELRKNKNRPQLWTYGMIDEPLDVHQKTAPAVQTTIPNPTAHSSQQSPFPEMAMDEERINQYATVLKTLVKKARVRGRRATASLPVSQVFHAIINLPKVEDSLIDGLVKAEVSKMLPEPYDNMQVVYQRVTLSAVDDKKFIRLLVTAAPKRIVAFYSSIFSRAGLELQELETEAFALARSLVGRDQSVSMVVDIGAERSNFYIVDNGLPMTHRSLQVGGKNFDAILAQTMGLEVAAVQQFKRDAALLPVDSLDAEAFTRLLDPIAKEIQYSFELYLHQSGNEGKRPEKIILTGGVALFPPVINYLTKNFPLRVFIGDPWARVMYQDRLKGVVRHVGPRISVSLGLALRNFS